MIEQKWEKNPDDFEKLEKEEFDHLCRSKQFTEGPLIVEPSKFDQEFGPYCPDRLAFGQLKDGRLVQTNVN